MASTISLPSKPLNYFSVSMLKWSATDDVSFSTQRAFQASEKESTASDVQVSEMKSMTSDDRPKIILKFRKDDVVADTDGAKSEKVEKASDGGAKVVTNVDGKIDEADVVAEAKNQSVVATDGHIGEKEKRKRPFSVSLAREEIEADILAARGCASKRIRRAKKRPRSVQRTVDNLFPGLRLKSITPDDYEVPDSP